MKFLSVGTILQTVTFVDGVITALNQDVLNDLICLECKSDLEYVNEPECLRCKNCQKEYTIVNGIPMMGGMDDRADNPVVSEK